MFRVNTLIGKTTISILSVVLIAMILGFLVVGWNEKKEAVDYLKLRTKTLSKIFIVEISSKFENIEYNKHFIQQLTEELGSIKGVVHVEIFDQNATIISHTKKERIGEKPLPIHVNFVKEVYKTGETIEEVDELNNRYNLFIPVVNKTEKQKIESVIELVFKLKGDNLNDIRSKATLMKEILELEMSQLYSAIDLNKKHLVNFSKNYNEIVGIDHLNVFDTKSKLIIYGDSTKPKNYTDEKHVEFVEKVMRSKKSIIDNQIDASLYTGFYPIYGNNLKGESEIISVVEIAMDIAYLNENIEKSRAQLFYLVISLLALSVLTLVYLLKRAIVRPIRELIPLTVKIGKEDFNQHINIKSKDEIGQLAKSFNQMIDQLKESRNLISHHEKALTVRNDELINSVKEKEVLLKEVHHRVKNNLQVIISLMSLQSNDTENKKAKEMFQNSEFRIKSMAMIHEMLYQSDNFSEIEYGTYVRELVQTLVSSYISNAQKIKLVVEIPELYLTIDTAIPLGLLINEIAINSLTHGFHKVDSGEIFISINKNENSGYNMLIGDNGVGFSEKTGEKDNSLGLRLINSLVKQLHGSIEKDNKKPGTNYIIFFK